MAHDDPFTIDLFGNTALASGFDLGMPGFAAEFGTDLDDDRPPSTPAPAVPVLKIPETKLQMRAKVDFRLEGSHGLAKSWRDRARDNIGAILLTNEIECQGLPARPDQQAKLIRFTGFGASDLASGIFRRPGEDAFRKGWEELGGNLESAVAAADYASLARCTQFAHFTPEFIVRAIWGRLDPLGKHRRSSKSGDRSHRALLQIGSWLQDCRSRRADSARQGRRYGMQSAWHGPASDHSMRINRVG